MFPKLVPFLISLQIVLLLLLSCTLPLCHSQVKQPVRHSSQQKNVAIAFVGDSTAMRLVQEIITHLNCHNNMTSELPIVGRIPNIKYWARQSNTGTSGTAGKIKGKGRGQGKDSPSSALEKSLVKQFHIHPRDCSGCGAKHGNCSRGAIASIEYATMEFAMDTELTTIRSWWDKTCPNDTAICYHAQTTQEFIFGEWWHGSYCPNVIFHLGTVVHDMTRQSPRRYAASARWMFRVIELFLDEVCPKTMYYWSTGARVAESKVSERHRNVTHNNNIVLYNNLTLQEFPRNHPRMRIGIDQYEYSITLSDDDFKDAVHMLNKPYAILAKRMLLSVTGGSDHPRRNSTTSNSRSHSQIVTNVGASKGS